MSLRDTLEFDKELHSLYETKLPVSASKISSLTKLAIKHAKLYKNIVYSVEKFIQKCPAELKLAGLYTIDSIARAAAKRPEEGAEPYIERFQEKLDGLMPHLLQAPPKDKERVKRTVGLWRKSALFSTECLDELDRKYFSSESQESTTTPAGLAPSTAGPPLNNILGGNMPGLQLGMPGAGGLGVPGLDPTALLGLLGAANQQTLPGLGNMDVSALLPLLQGQLSQQAGMQLPQNALAQLGLGGLGGLVPSVLGGLGNLNPPPAPQVPASAPSITPTPDTTNQFSGQPQANGQVQPQLQPQVLASSLPSSFSNPNDFDYGDEDGASKTTTTITGIQQSNSNAPAPIPTTTGTEMLQQTAANGTPKAEEANRTPQSTVQTTGYHTPSAESYPNPSNFGYQTAANVMTASATPTPGTTPGGAQVFIHPQRQQQQLSTPNGPDGQQQPPAPWISQNNGVAQQQHHQSTAPWQGTGSTQADQTPIGRPIPVVGSDREGVAPASPWQQAAAQGAKPPRPGDCLPGFIDPSLPKDFMKILTRTVYVGGITPNISKEMVRDLFETIARVDTVTVNYPKFNAFVKLLTRAEAELIKDRFHKYQYMGTMLKMGWGCGYGPKEFFDYTSGETLFPLARMTEVEKRTISQSTRGGGPIEGGMVVEEPDFGWPQKGEVCKGNFAAGQIPFAPGFLEAQKQRERGGFNNEAPTPAGYGGARPPFMGPGMSQSPRPGLHFGSRQAMPPGMSGMPPMPPPPTAAGVNANMPIPRPTFHAHHGQQAGRASGIMVVQDRQYDDRDERQPAWRTRQSQDRGEEHVVVLGGGDDSETTPSGNEQDEHNVERRDSDYEYSGRRGSGGPLDWYPGPPPPGAYAAGPRGGPWGRNSVPYGYPAGAPPARPPWGPLPPGWNGASGSVNPRKRAYSPDGERDRDDGRDRDRGHEDERQDDEDGRRRSRSRWE